MAYFSVTSSSDSLKHMMMCEDRNDKGQMEYEQIEILASISYGQNELACQKIAGIHW